MENSFQTSFIPKKPITTTTGGGYSRPPTSIFTVLSFLLLVIIGLASGGLFLYKNYLIKQESVLSSSLERVKETFEQNTLDELELYDKRVSAAKSVLDKHIIFSPMFALLGTITIPSVQYTNFTEDSNSQGFSVKLSGTSSDYKSIALQADAFNSAKGTLFKNVVFSNINKTKNNNVTFDIEFLVDPSLLSYEKNILTDKTQDTKAEQTQVKVDTSNNDVTLPSTDSNVTPIPENNNKVPDNSALKDNTSKQ
jgi:hypothetical protein